MPRPGCVALPPLLLCTALLLTASAARSAPGDSFSYSGRPKVRGIVGGGIALPLSPGLAAFHTGGGINLGLEWPQSDYHSLLLRLDYDHLGQDPELTFVPPGTDLGSANLTVLHVDVRFQREMGTRPVRNYIEAGLGLAYRSITEVQYYDYTTSSSSILKDSGAAGAFVLTSGTAYQPEGAALGFFLELGLVITMQSQDTSYFPIRVGITFP